MPREIISIPNRVESLSILSPDGQIDATLEPKISDADLKKLYKTMLSSRLFDERLLQLQRQGRIGTYGPTKGQEAASLGAAYVLKKDDWLVPSFRETAAMFWRGWPMEKIILWWGGHEEGATIPPGVNDLPLCVPVATQCLHAMGIAWGAKMRQDGTICVGFVGDGGTSEGDFHEALNFAAVYKVPLIMVVQNNHWAISIPRQNQTASHTIAQKALAYGMDGLQVDGNDILAMIAACAEAAERARTGGGPTLIEAVTYRLSMHTTADDPKKYRTDEEVKCWEPKDPLIRFRTYLTRKKLLNDKTQAEIETQIQEELRAAVARAEVYETDRYGMFKFMFADITADLQRQMAELREYLENGAAAASTSGGERVSRVL